MKLEVGRFIPPANSLLFYTLKPQDLDLEILTSTRAPDIDN
jgi:hypothetical protein